MPIASTSPSSESTLIENPRSGKKMNAPTSDRHGQQRDERRAPVLQEDEHDDDDEHHGFEERVNDLVDALGDRQGRVERHQVLHVAREPLRQIGHRRFDPVGHVERVRAGNLEHGNDRRGRPVVPAHGVVEHGSQFEARDVLEAHLGAVRGRAHDDVAELLLGQQASLRADGVGVFGARRGGWSADLTGRRQLVLLGDGVRDVRNRDAETADDVGPQPDAHGVIAAAEQVDLPDALDAGDRVVDVDGRVIREKGAVVSAVRRLDREHEQGERQRLLHRDAVVLDRLGHLGHAL
jgi:hypothetical protein